MTSKSNQNTDKHGNDDPMMLVLDHYLKHHQIVLKKLRIAKQSTHISINEIKDIKERFDLKTEIKEFKDIDHMNDLWTEIISLFEHSGISEEELHEIEKVLITVPKAIKQHYVKLLEQDQELTKLIETIQSDRYQKAYKIVKDIQNEPNPMSGLEAKEYNKHTSSVAFLVRPKNANKKAN